MKELLEGLQIQEGKKPRTDALRPRAHFLKPSYVILGSMLLSVFAARTWQAARTKAAEVEIFRIPTLPRAGTSRTTLTAGGYVKDPTIVYVVPRISGRIAVLRVNEGDSVSAGDVLATLDTRDLQKEVDEARANLLQAQSNLNKLRAGSRPEEIAEMRARVAAVLYAKERSHRDLMRRRVLFEAGDISAQDFDRVNTEYLVAGKNLDAARESLAAREAGARREELQMAEAAREASLARLVAANNRLSDAEVRAPISGRVLRKYRETGDRVSPEVPFVQAYDTIAVGSPVVAIAALDDQEVSVDINETDLAKVALRQPVEIVPNAFPNEKFSGSVTRVSPRADKNKNTIEVKVAFDKGARKLPYDLSVKLNFVERSKGPERNQIEIPSKALVRREGKHFVFVASNSRAELRRVEIVDDQPEMARVASGLAEGDQVIVSGIANLSEGARVTLK